MTSALSANRSPFSVNPLAEILYDFAALAAVTAFGYYFFWPFVILLVPAMLGSVALMVVESIIIQSDKPAAEKEETSP